MKPLISTFISAMLFWPLPLQNPSGPRLIFHSKEYQPVGSSPPQFYELAGGVKRKIEIQERPVCSTANGSNEGPLTALVDPPTATELKVVWSSDGKLVKSIKLPVGPDHWNYVVGIARSPDGKHILVGSEAGSSDSPSTDYWLLDTVTDRWRYAGTGNDAKWSPDGSKIVWSTPRKLEPLAKLHVWVVHLVLVDANTLAQQQITTGMSEESEFYWCP